MASYNSNKPNVGDEKEIDFKFAPDTDKELYKEEIIVPAGSTSWGPRIDLLLKPDVSAPGKNINPLSMSLMGNQLMVICQGLVWQLQSWQLLLF